MGSNLQYENHPSPTPVFISIDLNIGLGTKEQSPFASERSPHPTQRALLRKANPYSKKF